MPRHVALIDDVLTTGSTCEELAQVLKRAGVQRVDVWVVARAAAPTQSSQ
jgi:predicted amidophosphoribosyltransferase